MVRMKYYITFVTLTILTFFLLIILSCTSGKGNQAKKLLPFLSLTQSSSIPIEPDPEYTGSDCSCGYKSIRGSTLSKTYSLSQSNLMQSKRYGSQAYVLNELIVKFREGTDSNQADQIVLSLGAKRINHIPGKIIGLPSQVKHIRLPETINVDQAILEYSKRPEVEYAQPNYIYHTLMIPNDPNFNDLWGLHNTSQTINEATGISGKDIHAPEAWDIITDCSNVIVAVVDTGINYNHRDLQGNMWDGGPSYPNHGWDFQDNDNDPMDLTGHGTHVAGIIGAQGNDGTGVCGVCWKVKLMAVRVFDASGSGTTASVVSGINFAVTNGAHIVNLSLGTSQDDTAIKSAISNAQANGVIIVAAAGNDSSSSYIYPAAYAVTYNNVLSVGAVDQNGMLASFSNYGPSWVYIAAPGQNVLSTWPGQSTITNEDFKDWIKETGWGVGSYSYQGLFGPISETLLTNPSHFEYSLYDPNMNSAAYKVFDLGIYGASAATVGFYFDFDIDSSDALFFTLNPNGNRPEVSDGIYSVNGYTNGLMFAGETDVSKYMALHPSIGFLFNSDNNWEGIGLGIGSFETTRLYYNTTACRYLAGTSMATPFVSGVAALCIAQFINKYGSYTKTSDYTAIINSIMENYDMYTSLKNQINNGRMLNAYKAVNGI
jgi:thermitase